MMRSANESATWPVAATVVLHRPARRAAVGNLEEEPPQFDAEVLRAMARWPDVPECYGWLGLDARGQWRIKGESITHPGAVDFLGRNYASDDRGNWYVQNGPQKAYVDLAYTPWVYRFEPHAGFKTHNGREAGPIKALWLDDEGAVLVDAQPGVGVLDDRDMAALAAYIDDSNVPLQFRWSRLVLNFRPLVRTEVAGQFGFVPHPAPAAATPE